jgi:shikimate dehydrogenase
MTTRGFLVGLIGANISGSLSPALHEDAFAALRIRGHYHLMDLDQRPGVGLSQLFDSVKIAGFAGINVTFPCKQAIIPLLDEISAEARQVGAVNTVTIAEGGHSVGRNTDRIGFRRSFEDGLGRAAADGQVIVLVGAGGAGRAVGFALMDLGASRLIVHDTDAARTAALVADLNEHFGAARCLVADNLQDAMAVGAGVVNATPIGMRGFPGNPVPVAALRHDLWVADVIYTPVETQLIKAARASGASVLTGTGMCIHQAAAAFEIFTGLAPDLARMHRTFATALAQRDVTIASVD